MPAGAKGDLAQFDLLHSSMRPVRDPLKCLIYSGSAVALRDVFVNGEQPVKDRTMLALDHDDALDRLQEGPQRALTRVPELDRTKCSADEVSAFSLPIDRTATAAPFRSCI